MLPEVIVSEDIDIAGNGIKNVIKPSEEGINYDAFIPILVRAIQEQDLKIKELEAELRKLK